MVVYVIDKNGQPLMPTQRCGKVRRLLKEQKAKAVRRCPFTIQLLYEAGNRVKEITLGVDAGSKHIGLSASTEEKAFYEADVMLRNDIGSLLSGRREMRRTRRYRKTRYRKPRFNNRTHGKKGGWLAPSIEQKIGTHMKAVEDVCRILPVSGIIVEAAAFDMQKLKADMDGLKKPEGAEYQKGDQSGFWNVREYVLFRDGHKCRCCKGKSGDARLNVHHIQSRKTGGNAPNNLITLCETCHTGFHSGKVRLSENIKRGTRFNDAAFMGIMRWSFYNRLKETFPNVSNTYGYITKSIRIENGLSVKEQETGSGKDAYLLNHVVDARVISGHPKARSSETIYYRKKVRCHNRQLHKKTISKGGIRKRNQAPYKVEGFRLFDKVLCSGETGFIYGRRSSGSFDIRTLNGTKLSAGISYKKLTLLESAKHILTERRSAPLTTKVTSVRA